MSSAPTRSLSLSLPHSLSRSLFPSLSLSFSLSRFPFPSLSLPHSLFPSLSFSLLLLLLLRCSPSPELPYYHTPDFTPHWKSSEAFTVDTLHTIAPFQFINQDGDTITQEAFKDKIYVASFFYTICPGICPKLMANMEKVTNAFNDQDQVRFISHTVTPRIDSVAQLKKYATEHAIQTPQWQLVTGDQESIYTLARQSYFAEQEIGFQYSTQEFLHTEHFLLIDKAGHIRGIYKGTLELEADRLIEDIHMLLGTNPPD